MMALRKAKSSLQKRKNASVCVSPVVSRNVTPIRRNKIHQGRRYLDLTIKELSEKSHITGKRKSIDISNIANQDIEVTDNKLLSLM